MDILQKKEKNEFDNDIKILYKQLKFLNNPMDIKGSSSLKSQLYFSDYDFFCDIVNKYTPKKAYDTFINIFKKIFSNDDNYFIEFKIQTKDENKIRWYNLKDFNFDEFKKVYDNLDFCKIDLIKRINNKFIEVSCIYKFSNDELTTDDYLNNLKKDIKELEKEKNYYKILKRKFNIYKSNGDKKKLIELSNIFNSELGHKYQLKSNLEAIKKLMEKTDDELTKKKIIVNLKDNKMDTNINDIDNKIKSLEKEINTEAKKINNNFKI